MPEPDDINNFCDGCGTVVPVWPWRWLFTDRCYNYQWLANEDTGKVLTITCTLADMRSGDVVAVGALAVSADSTFGSWVQTGPSTASVDVSVKSISVSG